MRRWVVVGVLAAAAMALPCRAAAADRAAPGVPGQFDVFTAGAMTANAGGATIQGRVAANVAVSVDAPAVARVGEPVSYRVVARGSGRDGARSVRFCHRPPHAC
jgi:hypothetical protein